MEKLSECQDYKERIITAWSYCEEKGVLDDLLDLVHQWESIDRYIRWKYGAMLRRVPVAYYLKKLMEKIRESDNKKFTGRDLSLEHMSLCLYKIIENHLPDKLIDGRETLL